MKQRSTGFPRISLSSSVKIMTEASKMGTSWRKEMFAQFGAKSNSGSAKSGAFLARIAALRDYGLITSDKETINSTDLTQRIAKPINPQERETAIKQAFLSVGTFNDLYNALEKEQPLPRDKVAQHAVFNQGVSRDAMDKFINVFIDSGRYAGLVRYDKDNNALTLLNNDRTTEITSDVVTPHSNESLSLGSSIVTPVDSTNVNDGVASAQNEQGINHIGNGWSLTVLIKSGHRLPTELRKSIRDLLQSADSVADQFYGLEHKDK